MRHFTFIALAVAYSTGAAGQTPPELTLGKGAYRLEGQCTSMRSMSRDETSQCEGYMGIIASDPTKPEFLFQRKDKGAWLFVVSGPANYSKDGKTATYPVSSVLDTSANRAHDLPGECSLSVAGAPKVACAVSLKSGAKVKEATFQSSGTWAFQRDKE